MFSVVYCQKLLSLLKTFRTGAIATGQLSKVVGAGLPAFQKRIVHRQPICRFSKPARLPLAVFQKLSVQLRNLSFNRSKGFEHTSFEKLSKIQKLLVLNS
jgi:hypothetical protein